MQNCPKGNPKKPDESGSDIIINRHGDLDPSEIQRMLKAEGLFVTQQVGTENDSGRSV